MIRILILEDQTVSRNALREIILSAGSGEEIVVDSAASLAEGRQYVDGDVTYDAFFLDINLDEENSEDQSGVTFARYIREHRKYEFTPVIMVTSIANLEMSAYRELHCYQYLLKPYREEDVSSVIKKLLAMKNVKEEKTIVVKKDGINYRIKCNAIVYIQAIPRGVCLFLKRETMKVPYLTIVKLMEQLPEEDFLRCHRMYAVNKKYVETIDYVNRMIKMSGYDELVEIGGTYKQKIKDSMA